MPGTKMYIEYSIEQMSVHWRDIIAKIMAFNCQLSHPQGNCCYIKSVTVIVVMFFLLFVLIWATERKSGEYTWKNVLTVY